MKNFIKNRVRNFLMESNSQDTDYNICDDFSVNSMEELISLLKITDIKPEQKDEIKKLIDELKTSNDYLSNDLDNFNTVTHKISTILCK
jgi:hypothetical protein